MCVLSGMFCVCMWNGMFMCVCVSVCVEWHDYECVCVSE